MGLQSLAAAALLATFVIFLVLYIDKSMTPDCPLGTACGKEKHAGPPHPTPASPADPATPTTPGSPLNEPPTIWVLGNQDQSCEDACPSGTTATGINAFSSDAFAKALILSKAYSDVTDVPTAVNHCGNFIYQVKASGSGDKHIGAYVEEIIIPPGVITDMKYRCWFGPYFKADPTTPPPTPTYDASGAQHEYRRLCNCSA